MITFLHYRSFVLTYLTFYAVKICLENMEKIRSDCQCVIKAHKLALIKIRCPGILIFLNVRSEDE